VHIYDIATDFAKECGHRFAHINIIK